MKKLFVFLIICMMIAIGFSASTVFAAGYFAPVGSKVYVVVLEHQDKLLRGEKVPCQKGKIIGYKLIGWMLYSERLEMTERRSNVLPPGYTEWDFMAGQNWPGGKTGVPLKVPLIQIEDGTIITGNKCWWGLADKNLNDRITALAKKRLERFISLQLEYHLKDHPQELGLSTSAEVERFFKDHPNYLKKKAEDLLDWLKAG